ncbi:uncharacterized protein CANTADRAFT_6102 [Suhomyces tanzawaensis NRRL Y-17324]|uniref:Uncharacterized protein n=1 Tax=Suhomyces tanzawaensis NRRL Y-17324 TaxID=984487 RepID=A0A1E4SHD2_9ASCO|nr:uncharacterized protein CANTADRAFT_6102 [Suhomyces tanzawaensis NRRL Y-17324]ODV78897.1 hypothetical protein CANTADRAFT_6102 [Suhomyces tanzawaensis NRRL Y-17324]
MDKENIPTSPTRDQPLKPISPNKPGRLNFLQNDNIDEHFSQLHNAQHLIQQQLYNLEVQTKQTSLDVGQISDRLKNNNQHLNKLLQNIANYSEEVITEGNATKQDITNILEKLAEFSDELKKCSRLLDNVSRESSESVKQSLQEVLQGVKSSNNNEVSQQVQQLHSMVSELKSKELVQVSDEINQIKKSVTSNEDITDIKKVLTRVLQKDESLVLAKLNEIEQHLPERDLVRQIVDPVIAELKAVSLDSKSLRLLEDILSILSNTRKSDQDSKQFQTDSSELLALIKQSNAELATKLAEQTSLIEQLTANIKLQQSTAELQSKYDALQGKYEEMTRAYTSRFSEFKILQEHFKELASNTNRISVTDGGAKVGRLNKVRQLHASKMEEIGRTGGWRGEDKRIVSTPVHRVNEDEMNNSDEEY